MKEWFNFKVVSNAPFRTYGIMLRLFGIDVSVVTTWWINDWMLLDLRLPVNYGVYLQTLFAIFAIGRLPTSEYDRVLLDD